MARARRAWLPAMALFALMAACAPVRPPRQPEDALVVYQRRLTEVRNEMLRRSGDETEIDRKIVEAVAQLGATLRPEYKGAGGPKKWRLGFMEITDVDRRRVSRLHRYLTEKILTFSFLEPDIAGNMRLVERFSADAVWREAAPGAYASEREFRYGGHGPQSYHRGRVDQETRYDPYRIIDPRRIRAAGKTYGVAVIETGVVTVSARFIDLTLRIFETEYGRIIAVGAVKIDRTPVVNQWLIDLGWEGVLGAPPWVPEPPDSPYRLPERRD